MHTSIKNMFLHRNPCSTYNSLYIFNIRVNLLISKLAEGNINYAWLFKIMSTNSIISIFDLILTINKLK